jgi:hypothetical protein
MSTIFLYKHYLFTRLKHSFGLIFPGAWWCNKCFKVLFYGWLWCNQVGFFTSQGYLFKSSIFVLYLLVLLSFSSSPYRRCSFITRILVLLFFPICLISFSFFSVMYWLVIYLAYHSVEHILMLMLAHIWSVKYPSCYQSPMNKSFQYAVVFAITRTPFCVSVYCSCIGQTIPDYIGC